MKIIAPVDRPEEAQALIDAGADELFCGLSSQTWLGRYTIAAVSRRSARIASMASVESLAQTVAIAHAAAVPVCLALNEHYYTQAQHPLLFEYVDLALSAGVDSLIVADPALVLAIRDARPGIDLHLSTGTTVLNSSAARFFQDLGVSRITLERQQTIAEIGAVVRGAPGVESAVFILNGRCPNVDGLCTYDHVQIPGEAYRNACMLACRVRCHVEPDPGGDAGRDEYASVSPVVRQQIWERVHMDDSPCGVCAIPELSRLGVTHLKIVGRGNPTPRKLADVRFVRSLLTLRASAADADGGFRERARLLRSHVYRRPCRMVSCYFPELIARERRAS